MLPQPKNSQLSFQMAKSRLTDAMVDQALSSPEVDLATLVKADIARHGKESINLEEISGISREAIVKLALNHFRSDRAAADEDDKMILNSAAQNLRNAGLGHAVQARESEGYELEGYIGGLRKAASLLIHKIDPSPDVRTQVDVEALHDSPTDGSGIAHTVALARAKILASEAGTGFGRREGGPLTPSERAKMPKRHLRDQTGWDREH